MSTNYDFHKTFCVCSGKQIYLNMCDLDSAFTTSWPVSVYNINEEYIGDVSNKEQYINMWNSDEENQKIGMLSGLYGAFSFTLILKPNQSPPPYVIGVPIMIYDSNAYDSVYE